MIGDGFKFLMFFVRLNLFFWAIPNTFGQILGIELALASQVFYLSCLFAGNSTAA